MLIEAFNQVSQANRIRYLNRSQSLRERTANAVLSLMGSKLTSPSADDGKVEDSKDAEAQEAFAQNERAMIHSVLTLAERPIRVIATPRADVHRLDLSQGQDAQRKVLRDSPYSRLVVIKDGSIDEPLGIVARKDLLTQLLDGGEMNIDAALRQPLVLPETVTVLKALESFRQHSADMAFVVNEFGDLEGIVTQKDLMEAIAGEFPEEHERHERPAIMALADGSYDVEGDLELVTLEQHIVLGDFEDEDFHTVAGLLMDCLGAFRARAMKSPSANGSCASPCKRQPYRAGADQPAGQSGCQHLSPPFPRRHRPGHSPAWFYVLRCRDGALYTGVTTDVARRYAQHAAGKGARYTGSIRRKRWPWCWSAPAARGAEG